MSRWAMSNNRAKSTRGEAGFTLIDLLFTASLICTLCTMSLPGLLRARGAAQAAAAIGTLRVINSSQLSFAVTCGSGFYSPNFVALGVAPPNNGSAFLPPELATGVTFFKQGYNFSLSGTAHPGAPPTCNGQARGTSSPGYMLTADPLDGLVNPHYYGSNADGTIYTSSTTLVGWMPESGPPAAGSPIK
jgi:type II secretory pathway pseudopilin PulG